MKLAPRGAYFNKSSNDFGLKPSLRPQLVQALPAGMAGIAEQVDRPGASKEQIAAHEIGEAEIGVAGDESVNFVERRAQLPPLDFLENEFELSIGAVQVPACSGLLGKDRERGEQESRSHERGDKAAKRTAKRTVPFAVHEPVSNGKTGYSAHSRPPIALPVD